VWFSLRRVIFGIGKRITIGLSETLKRKGYNNMPELRNASITPPFPGRPPTGPIRNRNRNPITTVAQLRLWSNGFAMS